MQLNRNSSIVRWYLFANFCHSEEAKQNELAETTNLCVFVQWLVLGTLLWVLIGVLFTVAVPCGWVISTCMLTGGALVGFIPIGWLASFRGNSLARVLFPAVTFQWERKLGIHIGTRVVFPNHVWGTALAVLGVWALGRMEVAGWSRDTIPVAWITIHELVLLVASGVVAVMFYARWRNTEGWRVLIAWLRAKKDRVCPRIEFVE